MLRYPRTVPACRWEIKDSIWSGNVVQRIYRSLAVVAVLGLSLTGMAQQNSVKKSSKPAPAAPAGAGTLTPEQKFVIDTVKMAVALPESDPQDRLRVLSSAADVASPIDKKMARQSWSEGARME